MDYNQKLLEKVENKQFSTRCQYFADGENTGHMLAVIASSQSPSNYISFNTASSGLPTQDKDVILEAFHSFYSNLYGSNVQYEMHQLTEFLNPLKLPCLVAADRQLLNPPLTLEEHSKVVTASHNNKAPSPDGLPSKIYKSYGDVLFPEVLKIFNSVVKSQYLPDSKNMAGIIVIPKEKSACIQNPTTPYLF